MKKKRKNASRLVDSGLDICTKEGSRYRYKIFTLSESRRGPGVSRNRTSTDTDISVYTWGKKLVGSGHHKYWERKKNKILTIFIDKKKLNDLGGPLVLWHGSVASASATIVGHFPWFFTFNFLQVFSFKR